MNLALRFLHFEIRKILRATSKRLLIDDYSFTPIWVSKCKSGYMHRWIGGGLIWHEPTSAAKHITKSDLTLFSYGYSVKKNDKVLIVGAGVGAEIHYFSKQIGRHGQIYAIEPDERAFNRMVELVQTLKIRNVKLFQVAISNFVGQASLVLDSEASATNYLHSSEETISGHVEVTTLSKFCLENKLNEIDYLKLNIEGEEMRALQGIGNSVIVHNFCISCHDFLTDRPKTYAQVEKTLTKRGFQTISPPISIGEPWVEYYIFAQKTD